jgi:hypothetical protein
MSIIQTLLQWYDAHRIPDAPYWITQSYLYRHLDSLPDDLFKQRTAGTSSEGRPIRLLSLGSGPTPVLLWSQMHGDEPTATRALLDIFSIVRRERDHEIIRTILSQCTLYILPMVNPDGAERFSRRTALGIDMNRDALALRTPEAAILKSVRNKYNPRWAYSCTTRNRAIRLAAPAMRRESRCCPPHATGITVLPTYDATPCGWPPASVRMCSTCCRTESPATTKPTNRGRSGTCSIRSDAVRSHRIRVRSGRPV